MTDELTTDDAVAKVRDFLDLPLGAEYIKRKQQVRDALNEFKADKVKSLKPRDVRPFLKTLGLVR